MSKVSRIVALACLVAAVTSARFAQADLAGYWAMDDNAASTTVVNGVNAAYNGDLTGSSTAALHASGKIGGAILAGSSNYTAINNAGGLLSSLTGDYTVSVWALSYNYPATGEGALFPGMLFSFGRYIPGAQIDSRIQLETSGAADGITGYLDAYASGAGSVLFSAQQTWAPLHWYNFAMTVSQGTARLYSDGSLLGTSTGTFASPSALTQSFAAIGALTGWNDNCRSAMDDVAVWNTALSGTQIKAIGSLADAGLNYSAQEANTLFGAFTGQSSVVVNGKTWYYKASGTGSIDGAVTDLGGGNWSLDLGAGAGMSTVPEPSTIGLLVSGLLSLLAYAWRKRK